MGIRKTFVPPSQGDGSPERKFRVTLPEVFAGACMSRITAGKGSINEMKNEAGQLTMTGSIPSANYDEVVRELSAFAFAVFTSLD